MRYKLFILILLCSHQIMAQHDRVSHDEKVNWFLREDLESEQDFELARESNDLNDVLIRLKEKQLSTKSEIRFLESVFYTVHKKLLFKYEQYVTFGEIFSKEKKYDCVTGTALYALVLEELGYRYDIHETDYHVYLVVNASNRRFLFEATDPITGFVADEREIDQRCQQVNKQSMAVNIELATTMLADEFNNNQEKPYIDNVVSLKQLSGLHYYNQALKKFNESDYQEAYQLIMKAYEIYPSERIKYMGILAFSVAFED